MRPVKSFQDAKNSGTPISMVTCYDYWSARIIDNTDVDAVLVGDSAAMVMYGYDNTVNADLDMMSAHIRAVSRGLINKFLIADLPFLAHRKGLTEAINAVEKLIKAGAQAVKIEGAEGHLEIIKHIVQSGIPVMGHLGLTPQSVHAFGGFKVQGKNNGDSDKIAAYAAELQDAGCFALVLEMVPASLAENITSLLSIPTIGIGAGGKTSGQVLVLQDLLGMNDSFNPKFLRKYMDGENLITNALNHFNDDVKNGNFPGEKESF